MPDERCWANHMGLYLAEPRWLVETVKAVRSGTLRPHAHVHTSTRLLEPGEEAGGAVLDVGEWRSAGSPLAEGPPADIDPKDMPPPRYCQIEDGVAVIDLDGPMMKGRSKFGGCSTRLVRRAVREATTDLRVQAIMLRIYSPGDHVEGTQDLGDDVAAAAKTKLVWAHIEDLGASAAYWVASQAKRITANRTAEVGSIGVYAVVDDESKRFEEAGVTVHVLSTGPQKGAFVQGAPVKPEHLERLQAMVDAYGALFLEAVSKGRRLKGARLEKVATGATWIAQEALDLGLIDEVQSFEGSLAALRAEAKAAADANKRKRQMAELRQGLDAGS